ncbi:MAG: DNA mismatch repair endonuclease MutL [Firmicutes bacterium]|nr:DNA mismatch repair endonuclease MutL [Bacillota bacterium]
MNKINILEPSVYNRIAAGEVVERPASIVKELVENSLDAGSTKIEIEITGGGIDKIIISDNGVGIAAGDLKRAFLPHATSKIKSADDLGSIATLGFRGEALSSIAAVSTVKMVSKTKASVSAGFIEIDNGEVADSGETGAPDGTRVEVNGLFYKVPARKKFLKTNRQEESEITNVVSRLILANPTVAFTYVTDGKRIFQSSGKSAEDAVVSVYSASAMQSIIPVSGGNNELKLSGFIGKPSFAKSNRTYQTLIINGRYVINYQVSAAAGKAYSDFLMKNQFPFYVLYLTVPHGEVDVNVHPNKLEVRFEDNQRVFGLVLKVIEEALISYSQRNIEALEPVIASPASRANERSNPLGRSSINRIASSEEVSGATRNDSNPIIQEIILEAKQKEPEPAKQVSIFETSADKGLTKTAVKLVGKLYNTFLLVEADNTAYIIDQHAAHERVLFDEFNAQVAAKTVVSQMLLVPYVFNVNHSEAQFLSDNADLLKELGFELAEFGHLSFKVSTVPGSLIDMDIGSFFNGILQSPSNQLAITTKDVLKEKLAQSACKAAVKAGMDLTEDEVLVLINRIKSIGSVLLCPHGRPIAVELSRSQIDKWFKRVL